MDTENICCCFGTSSVCWTHGSMVSQILHGNHTRMCLHLQSDQTMMKLSLLKGRRSRKHSRYNGSGFCSATPQVSNPSDGVSSGKTRCPVLLNAIERYLWFPVAGAAIEQSFSLAGLIETKLRQKLGPGLGQGAVTMFRNSDVEGRFTQAK